MRHIVLSVCAVCLLAACNTADKQGIATSIVKGADGNELTVCHYQDVSDMWWSDPDDARKMLERKREPLRRLQAISEEGYAAPLEEIQALALYLLREELTGLLSLMKGNKGWTEKHAEFFDIFEFAETAKLAATPSGKRGAYGEPVGLKRGQETALDAVEARWEAEEPGIWGWLTRQDPALRSKNVYGRAARYAEEFAAKADAAHGQLDNLEPKFGSWTSRIAI